MVRFGNFPEETYAARGNRGIQSIEGFPNGLKDPNAFPDQTESDRTGYDSMVRAF